MHSIGTRFFLSLGNVFFSLAERRQRQADTANPVKKIFSKASGPHLASEITGAAADQSRLLYPFCPKTGKALHQLRLNRSSKITDFLQKYRPGGQGRLNFLKTFGVQVCTTENSELLGLLGGNLVNPSGNGPFARSRLA